MGYDYKELDVHLGGNLSLCNGAWRRWFPGIMPRSAATLRSWQPRQAARLSFSAQLAFKAMADQDPAPTTVTAALSSSARKSCPGGTRDENIAYIAAYLTRVGIMLREIRVVADIEAEIVAAVNALRPRFTYVFTTGGIGPTHDDVTTDAIAKAFAVEVVVDPEAVAAMRQRFSDQELTPARLRMARIPKGAAADRQRASLGHRASCWRT